MNGKVSLKRYDVIAACVILLLALLVNYKPISEGLLFKGHDVFIHSFWLEHFYRELRQGIIYPHWLGAANDGLGSPSFVFYPPLVYYIGSALRACFNLTTETAIIVLFTLAVFAAGISFYAFGRTRWHWTVALASASFYVLSPYLTYDIYIRSSLAETCCFWLLPQFFLFTELAVRDKRYCFFLVAIFACLFLTNVPSSILIFCAWLVAVPFCVRYVKEKNVLADIAKLYCLPALAGVLLAFYLLPSTLEQRFVNVRAAFDFPLDHIFQREIRTLEWTQVGIAFMLGALAFYTYRKQSKIGWIAGGWLVLASLITAINTRPGLIWFHLQPLFQYVQFGWRALMLMSMLTAVCVGYILNALSLSRKSLFSLYSCAFVVSLFIVNLVSCYGTTTQRMGIHSAKVPLSADFYKYTEFYVRSRVLPQIVSQGTGFPEVPEYVPIFHMRQPVPDPPWDHVSGPQVFSPFAHIEKWTDCERQLLIDAPTSVPITVRTFYFPGWRLSIDGCSAPLKATPDGLMEFEAPAGLHHARLTYGTTADQRLGLIISAVALGLFILWALKLFSSPRIPRYLPPEADPQLRPLAQTKS